MPIGEDLLKKLDSISDKLTEAEKLLIDAYVEANNALHNAGEMIELKAYGTAKILCQSGDDKRQSYLLNFIESKLR